MRLYRQLADIPDSPAGRFVTVGTFDGVHRGHQALLHSLCQEARQMNIPACVVTFDPHPQYILGTRPFPGILSTTSEKLAHFRRIGIDEVFLIPFTAEFARTEPEEFVREWLVARLRMRAILIGHDHMFGQGRRGNIELLQRLGAELGFTVVQFPAFTVGELPISSSRIRRALQSGAVEQAAELLGYPYTVCGTVVHGDGRGRSLGFPTANLALEDPRKLLPAYGVYIVTTLIAGTPYAGLASYGVRPTFGSNLPPQLEVHILDFHGPLYNERLCLSFWKWVRAEMSFPDTDSLQHQMRADVNFCRAWIAEHRVLERSLTEVAQPNAD